MNDIVTALRKMADGDWLADPVSPRRAADEIERLLAERNEARREACRLNAEIRMRDARADGMSSWFYSARQVAEERGWDCFKENA